MRAEVGGLRAEVGSLKAEVGGLREEREADIADKGFGNIYNVYKHIFILSLTLHKSLETVISNISISAFYWAFSLRFALTLSAVSSMTK